MARTLIALFILLIACDGFRQSEDPSAELTNRLAMQLAFERASVSGDIAYWNDTSGHLIDFDISGEEPLKSQILGTYHKPESNEGIAVFQTREDICDHCIPIIGTLHFNKGEEKKWEHVNSRFIDRTGLPEEVLSAEIYEIGEATPGIFVYPGRDVSYLNVKDLQLFARNGNGMKKILSLNEAAKNNKQACEEDETTCFSWETKINIIQNGEVHGFYDLELVREGTTINPEDSTIENLEESVRYTFNGSEFVRTDP